MHVREMQGRKHGVPEIYRKYIFSQPTSLAPSESFG